MPIAHDSVIPSTSESCHPSLKNVVMCAIDYDGYLTGRHVCSLYVRDSACHTSHGHTKPYSANQVSRKVVGNSLQLKLGCILLTAGSATVPMCDCASGFRRFILRRAGS